MHHKCTAGAAARQQLHDAATVAFKRLDAVQQRRQHVWRDLERARDRLEGLRCQTKTTRAAKQRIADAAAAESDWVAQPGAVAALAIVAGPLAPQEVEELQTELGLTEQLALSGPWQPLEEALELLQQHNAAAAARLLQRQGSTKHHQRDANSSSRGNDTGAVASVGSE